MDVRLRPRRKHREDQSEPESDAEPRSVLPSACPRCDGEVYLDSINLARETTVQTCLSCSFRWESPID